MNDQDDEVVLGYGRYEDVAQTLEQAITPGPYLLQQRFTAADIYIGAQIGFGLMTRSLDPRPAFQRYVDQLTQRPAYQRFQQQSDQLVARLKATG
jgi:glutathione S-transferase